MPETFPLLPPELANIPGRELAYLSQTDVTDNPTLGFQFAVAAYAKGLGPEGDSDPTLAGEAAAKAGFRAAQLNQTNPELLVWFDRSQRMLDPNQPSHRRELLGSWLLEGRSFALKAVRGYNTKSGREAAKIAQLAFYDSEELAASDHTFGDQWDPYATMLAWSHAAHEATRPQGHAVSAAIIASRGIWRALRARPETANQVDILSVAEQRAQHAHFIGKQVALNMVALSLAVSKPLVDVKPVARQRRRVAEKLLG